MKKLAKSFPSAEAREQIYLQIRKQANEHTRNFVESYIFVLNNSCNSIPRIIIDDVVQATNDFWPDLEQ